MKNLFRASVFSLVFLIPSYAISQNAAPVLTLERVFSDPPISGPTAGATKLSPDGKMLTFLKPKQDNAMVQDLWGMTIATGESFVLLDADKLSNSNKELSPEEIARRERMRVSVRGVVDYSWDENGNFIIVPLDGDIYSIDLKTRAIKRLTETESDEIDAKLSANGKKLGFVRDGQLWVKDIASGLESAVSPKAEGDISYAAAEFIAQEELGRYEGYWFSADGSAIAFQKTDETRVEVVERMEISANGAKLVKQKYPYAGKPNAIVELYVKTEGANAIKMDLGPNDDFYLARVNWNNDGSALYVQKLSRDQKTLDLISFNPKTGKGTVILSEKSNSWVELHDDFKILKNGDFIWSSERDGNNHLYVFDKNGKLLRQITKGDWVVKKLSAVNEKNDLIYFEASIDTPIENNLYVTKIHKLAPNVQITKSGGWWTANLAKSAETFVGSYSDPKTPPNTALYDNTGKRIKFIEENPLNSNHPYYPYKDAYPEPEFGKIKSMDNQDLHYFMLKPKNFDQSKKYPVVVNIYGGPARAMVRKDWVSPGLRLFQEKGFIVFTLDNRGTPQRSVDFTRAIYRKFGGPDIDDQILGAKYLQSLSFVDKGNIGIFGWSQGGFVTLMALSVKDSPFKAGVAGAPPTEWGLYDTAYTERYMDTPQNNKDGYAASDVLNRIENIKPNSLMIAHGMADDNVLLGNTTRVVAELQKRGVPFEMMLYPGEKHGLKGYKKRMFQWNLMMDFFERKLK